VISRKNSKFVKQILNLKWIYEIHNKLRVNSRDRSEFIINSLNKWLIHNSLIHNEFTLHPVPFSRVHYEFTIYFANSSESTPFLVYSRELFWINYEFTTIFANSSWIHYLLREITKNSLFVSQIDFESTIFSVYLLLIREFLTNSLSVSQWNHFCIRQFTIFLANSL